MLDRRLPVVCLVRFLSEAEVCPNFISVAGLFEMVAKYLPPSSNNHREVIFYSPETAANYCKEYLASSSIKLIEGDIGLNFCEFQLVMLRIAFELSKESHQKGDCIQMVRKLLQDMIGLRGSPETVFPDSKRKTKFLNRLQSFAKTEHDKKSKHSKKKVANLIEDDMDLLEEDEAQEVRDESGVLKNIGNVKIMFDL
jgi:hypothetical protein